MDARNPAGSGELRESVEEPVRHEIGNMITIAQANVEGMIDGVVEPTLDRLEAVRDALASASALLKELATREKERRWRS